MQDRHISTKTAECMDCAGGLPGAISNFVLQGVHVIGCPTLTHMPDR